MQNLVEMVRALWGDEAAADYERMTAGKTGDIAGKTGDKSSPDDDKRQEVVS